MKLETYLRMAGISYEISEFTNPAKAPKGKGPYITDDLGEMGDSSLIIDYLTKKHGVTIDADLTPEQKALAHSYQIMVEERLYWVIVYSRWAEDANWPYLKELFFGDIPWPGSMIVPSMVRKSVLKNMNIIGLARHTPDEIYEFGKQDIRALAVQLGDKDYFLGDKPHVIDATVHACIANMMIPQFSGPLLDEINCHENLKDYHQRMTKRYYN